MLETKDYLPYGEIPIEKPTFHNASATSLEKFLNGKVSLIYNNLPKFDNLLENFFKTSINSIYRKYFVENKRNFLVTTVLIDKNGTTEIETDEDEPENKEEEHVGEIYDIISDFLKLLREFSESNYVYAKYIDPHFLKASRYLWNRHGTNTSIVFGKVLTNAIVDYIDGIELPTKFSVSTIEVRGERVIYEKMNPEQYYIFFEKDDAPEETELDLFIKDKMISGFVVEFDKRIKTMNTDFSIDLSRYFERPSNIILYELERKGRDHWKLGSFIGAGASGKVYESCLEIKDEKDEKSPNCDYVMKASICDNPRCEIDFQREVEITNLAYTLGIAPKIEDFYISKSYSVIIMERMDVPLVDIFRKLRVEEMEYVISRILETLTFMHRNGIVHVDPHFGNIMFKMNNRADKGFWATVQIVFN
jgi:Protein kinase domain